MEPSDSNNMRVLKVKKSGPCWDPIPLEVDESNEAREGSWFRCSHSDLQTILQKLGWHLDSKEKDAAIPDNCKEMECLVLDTGKNVLWDRMVVIWLTTKSLPGWRSELSEPQNRVFKPVATLSPPMSSVSDVCESTAGPERVPGSYREPDQAFQERRHDLARRS